MSEQSLDNEKANGIQRSKKRSWSTLTLVFVVVLCILFWRVFFYESVDEKLAAIEAARAIPDSENAAIIYNQLLEDYNESHFQPAFLTRALDARTRRQPWSSRDHPELAEWLKECQDTIEKLLKVCEFNECRFPIPNVPEDMAMLVDRTTAMRKFAHLLVRSANNDIAEGRIEQGLEKCFCLIRMGRHCRQQPVAIDLLVGIAMETLALQSMRFCILQTDLMESHLRDIETALKQSDVEQARNWDNMLKVENLYARKAPLFYRLTEWLQSWQSRTLTFDRIHEIRRRFLADRQGTRILIALRRYKRDIGHWPESLDEIQALVAEDTLIDPQNNGSFVYKRTEDEFVLYSRGPNNIDEAGRRRAGVDDRPIWPLQVPQVEAERTNTEQPNANNEPVE